MVSFSLALSLLLLTTDVAGTDELACVAPPARVLAEPAVEPTVVEVSSVAAAVVS